MAKSLRNPRNARTVRGWLIAAAGLAFALASVAGPARAADDDPYARPEAWLCRPGASDLCAAPVVATVVQSDGSRATRVFKPNPVGADRLLLRLSDRLRRSGWQQRHDERTR